MAAAAEEAHRGPVRLVLTGRAENHIHGRDDLADTIDRLQRYQEAGADVLYAPGLADLDDIRRVVDSVDRPVNVLTYPGLPSVPELAAIGVARISVGGFFAFAAIGAVVEAASELRDEGTYGFIERARAGGGAARRAFGLIRQPQPQAPPQQPPEPPPLLAAMAGPVPRAAANIEIRRTVSAWPSGQDAASPASAMGRRSSNTASQVRQRNS